MGQQRHVLILSTAGRSILPGKIAALADAKNLAETLDGEFPPWRKKSRLSSGSRVPAARSHSRAATASAQGLSPREIDAKYVSAGKDAPALMLEPNSTAGRLKIGRSALDKRNNYRGMTANHLTRQVTGFRAFDKDAYRREDDLYDAAMYAALISLGDGTEARWSRLK